MFTDESLFRAEPRVVFTELADGTGLLLHLQSKLYFTLNRSAVSVWKRIEASAATRSVLVNTLVEKFECGPEQARRDLDVLLEELVGERLVHRA